jgi:hypothetical protein
MSFVDDAELEAFMQRVRAAREDGHTCYDILGNGRCERCRELYEASIVKVPESWGVGLAELLRGLVHPKACNTFKSRREEFLAKWLVENMPESLMETR